MHGIGCVTGEMFPKAFSFNRSSSRLESSLCYLPGEALQDDVSSVVKRLTVPDISGFANRQTGTHNTGVVMY